MKINKVVLTLGITGIASLFAYIASAIIRKRFPNRMPFYKCDEEIDSILECLDKMIVDIKLMHEKLKEQGERLIWLEERCNSNSSGY